MMPMMTRPLLARFDSAEALLEAYDTQLKRGGLLIPGVALEGPQALGACRVRLELLASHVEVDAQIASVVPGVGVAVMWPGGLPKAVEDFVSQARAPSTLPLHERLKGLTVPEKMQLALSGDRDARGFLLRDTNKSLHLYVLKNPRIGLDEVAYAAKLATLSPEAIKYIAEHRDWSVNAGICGALARNPGTPMPLALKLLPRVALPDLKALAKGGARQPIVQAARKLVAAGS